MYEVVTAIQLSPISDVCMRPSTCRQWCHRANVVLPVLYLITCLGVFPALTLFPSFFPHCCKLIYNANMPKKKRKAVITNKSGWNTIVEIFKQRKNSQDTFGQMAPMYFSVYNSGTRLVWWNSWEHLMRGARCVCACVCVFTWCNTCSCESESLWNGVSAWIDISPGR